MYSKIKFPPQYSDLLKVDGPISWYEADQQEQLITLTSSDNKHLFELDVGSAYPTICYNLYGEENPLVKEILDEEDKLKRNILIATRLKGTDDLRRLNNICKIIIFGVVFDSANSDNVLLLELKKDGFCGYCDSTNINKLHEICQGKSTSAFSSFLIDKGFTFHMETYDRYIRYSKTSFFKSSGHITIKGQYKNSPRKLRTIIEKIIHQDITTEELLKLKTIYSQQYFQVAIHNNLDEILYDYYICNENGKLLDANGQYISFTRDMSIDPAMYLRTFIYPIISSIRIKY